MASCKISLILVVIYTHIFVSQTSVLDRNFIVICFRIQYSILMEGPLFCVCKKVPQSPHSSEHCSQLSIHSNQSSMMTTCHMVVHGHICWPSTNKRRMCGKRRHTMQHLRAATWKTRRSNRNLALPDSLRYGHVEKPLRLGSATHVDTMQTPAMWNTSRLAFTAALSSCISWKLSSAHCAVRYAVRLRANAPI